MRSLFTLALALTVALACQKPEAARTETSGGTTAAAEKTHTMHGRLVSRDAATNDVTIDNEEVPGGVMAAMVMAYELRGARVDSLPPDGTRISSTLHVQDGRYWVTDIKAMQ